jgi:Carboxypeptidase regulatory-like domain/TonB dependent receptor-like, beta-barrel
MRKSRRDETNGMMPEEQLYSFDSSREALTSRNDKRSSRMAKLASQSGGCRTSAQRAILVSVCIVGLFFVAVGPAYGQIDRGTIEGRVTDETGAVVPGAKVQVVQTTTNSTLSLAADAQGLYTAANLPIGTYRVTVTVSGFKTVSREPVIVNAGATVRVDFSLVPGTVTQTVHVSGTAPLLNVGSTINSTALQSNLVSKMPVIVAGTQRSIDDYLTELPGYTAGGSFTPRANGAPSGDTEIFIDGAPASEWGIARGTAEEVSPLIEQVQSVNVVTNAFNAEYGGFGSWYTNATIKSGTNTIHGSIFDHWGNAVLDAKSYFQSKVTPYNQHLGGFTVGGPVVLPRIYNGRDKTFFFGSLGLFYSRVGAGGGLTTIPTQQECNGDFSGLGVPIYDPATTQPDGHGGFIRQQFSYNGVPNVIPPDRISAAAKLICSYVPPPTYANLVNNNYVNPAAATWPFFDTWTPLVKVDQSLSDNEKLSVMYMSQIRHRLLWENLGAQSAGLGPHPQWGAPQTNPLDWITDQIANSWRVRINLDSILTPTLLNHVTLGVDRYINLGPNATDGQGWDQKLGITGIPSDNGSFPAISFSGGTGLPVNFGRAYEEDWHETRYSLDETLTWTRGQHVFKFGTQIGWNREIRFIKGGVAGSFTFSNLMTSQPDAPNASSLGSSFASFLLGDVSQASSYIPLETDLRFHQYGIFAQDDWHILPKLTLSYGLRWDYQPPESEVHNYMTSFEPNLTNPGAGSLLGALAYAGTGPGLYGRPFQDAWHKGFAPRLGLAYQFSPKMIVRASSGIYYAGSVNQVPFLDTGALGYNANPSFRSADGYTPLYDIWAQSFPQNYTKPPAIDPSFLNGQQISYIPRNGDRLPQTLNWVLAIEREITPNLSLDVSYIGSHSTHLALGGSSGAINYLPASDLGLGFLLLQPINSTAAMNAGYTEPFPGFANQLGANTVAQSLKPYPQYTFIQPDAVLLPEGKSKYNALQIKLTQRTSHGLSGLAFFTWSKNLTNAAGAGNTTYSSIGPASFIQYPGSNPEFVDPGNPAAIFGADWSYDLPFGRGRSFLRNASTPLDLLLGGWNFSGTLRYTSGAALQIDAINPFASTFGYSSGAPFEYANYVGGSPYASYSGGFNPATDTYLNPAAFKSPALFKLGNTATYNGWARGFSQGSEAFEVGKTFQLHERLQFELSADFVNPFNIVRWANPSTLAGIPTFGKVTNIQGTPRQIQINANVNF